MIGRANGLLMCTTSFIHTYTYEWVFSCGYIVPCMANVGFQPAGRLCTGPKNWLNVERHTQAC